MKIHDIIVGFAFNICNSFIFIRYRSTVTITLMTKISV